MKKGRDAKNCFEKFYYIFQGWRKYKETVATVSKVTDSIEVI